MSFYTVKIPKKMFEIHKVPASDAESAKRAVLSGQSVDVHGFFEPDRTSGESESIDTSSWTAEPFFEATSS